MRCLFTHSALPLAPFFSLFLLHITQAPFLVTLQGKFYIYCERISLKGILLFRLLFSLTKTCMHNYVGGYTEILEYNFRKFQIYIKSIAKKNENKTF